MAAGSLPWTWTTQLTFTASLPLGLAPLRAEVGLGGGRHLGEPPSLPKRRRTVAGRQWPPHSVTASTRSGSGPGGPRPRTGQRRSPPTAPTQFARLRAFAVAVVGHWTWGRRRPAPGPVTGADRPRRRGGLRRGGRAVTGGGDLVARPRWGAPGLPAPAPRSELQNRVVGKRATQNAPEQLCSGARRQ